MAPEGRSLKKTQAGETPGNSDFLRLAVTGLAYFAANKIALLFPDAERVLAAVWPAAGVGLAALLLSPRTLWPRMLAVIFISGNIANLVSGRPLVNSLCFMAANCLESYGSAWLITRWCGASVKFNRIREITALVCAVTLVNAVTTTIVSVFAFVAGLGAFKPFWVTWWVSDGLGLLIVTPAIVSWGTADTVPKPFRSGRFLETVCFYGTMIQCAFFVFHHGIGMLNISVYPFLIFAVISWGALRFDIATIASSALILAIIAVTGEAVSMGPLIWGGDTPQERLLIVQLFIGILTSTGLFLSTSLTETRDAAKTVRNSEERFRTLIEKAPEAIVVFDAEQGKIVAANHAAERLFGCSQDELLEGGPQRFYAQSQPDGRAVEDSMPEYNRRVFAGEEVTIERSIRTADGRDLLCELHLVRLPSESGRLIRGSFQDITERKESEKRIEEVAKRLELATASASLGVWDWNVKDNTMVWDDQMLNLYGYTRQTFPGGIEAWQRGLHPDDREATWEACQSALRGDCNWDHEFRIMRPDGEVRWLKANGEVIRDRDGSPVRMLGINRDISHRKETEHLLREKEFFFRESQQAAMVGSYKCDFIAGMWESTEVLDSLFGIDAHYDRSIQGWLNIVHPEDRDMMDRYLMEEVISNRKTFSKEYRIVRQDDGEIRWVNGRGAGEFDSDGNLLLLMGTILDITEQRASEENLRKSEEKNRIILQTTMDGFWLLSAGQYILNVNDAYCQMSGYSRQELVGMHIKELEAMDSEEVIAERSKKIAENGGDLFESQHRRKDGSIFHVGVSVKYLPLDGGQLAVFVRDITERKLAETELRQSKAMLQAAMDCSPAGIAIANAPDGRLLYVNDAGLRMRGADRESVVNCVGIEEYAKLWKLFDLSGRELRIEEIPLARAIMFGEMNSREFIIRPSEDDDRVVLANAAPICDESGTIQAAIVVFTDITDRRRIEEEKDKLENQLYQAQKMEAVGQLAGGVAHDFNNILTVIGGYCALLQMDGGLSYDQKRSVDEIACSAEKAAQLTHGLLAFSRKQPMIMKHENLNDIVQHVHKFLARIIGEDITLQSACCGAELPIVADRGQLEQLLINLATNARDAMPGGGVLTVKSDHVVLESSFTDFHKYAVPPGNYALLTVSDTGTGISKEHIDHIFEPFFTTKEVGKGTGLGMAIIYGIIKQHNGFVNVYSELSHGTTLRIYLPIVAKADGLHAAKAETVPPAGGKETILVAEDEPSVRTLVAKVLENRGYTVILAENGVDAVEKFKAHQDTIRLILMDLIMPEKNGKEAYEEINRIKPGIRLLYTSGYTADFIENRGVSEEAVELIMKPVQPMELLRRVREMLDK